MKKITTIIFTVLVSTMSVYSQAIDDNRLGVLLSNDRGFGSARFEAMSGAFGALGGISSSVSINPAGPSVANGVPLSISLGVKSTDTKATYYGTTTNSGEESFNFNQIGGILVFDTEKDSDWNKFALTFNYQLKSDFQNQYYVEGNSGIASYTTNPDDVTKTEFLNSEFQKFENTTKGYSNQVNVGLSAAYENKLHIGASFNFHSFNYQQTAILREKNNDGNGNTLKSFNEQYKSFRNGDYSGLSLSAGFIYNFDEALRIGLAYESPTWYTEVLEDTNVSDKNEGYTEIRSSTSSKTFRTDNDENGYVFRLRTPSKVTASAAYVFEKKGLISVDYSYKNYSGIKFSEGNFIDINKNYNNDFRGVSIVNVGTEWRFDDFSIRGGYHFEQNPIKGSKSSDNLQGFSGGLGYNFGDFSIDLAYRRDKQTDFIVMYPENSDINSAELDNSISRFTASLNFKL